MNNARVYIHDFPRPILDKLKTGTPNHLWNGFFCGLEDCLINLELP